MSLFDPDSTISPRKRRGHVGDVPIEQVQGKRRRPNLANTFSGLSLGSQAPCISPATFPVRDTHSHEVDEDDLAATGSARDISVKGLPHTSHSSRHASSSSASSSDSDATFRFLRGQPVQASEVIEDPDLPNAEQDIHVEEVATRLRKRHPDEYSRLYKRRRGSMDVVMESRPHRRTQWFEPEKDRIIITSLGSDSSSSSRSPSPTRLSQPGPQGFTLSPSLLNRLLNLPATRGPEMGMVLYRPPPRVALPETAPAAAHEKSAAMTREEPRETEMSEGMETEMSEGMDID